MSAASYTSGRPSESREFWEVSREMYDLSVAAGADRDFMDTAALTAAVAIAAAETAPELAMRSARLFLPLDSMESNDGMDGTSSSSSRTAAAAVAADSSSSSVAIAVVLLTRLSDAFEDVILTPLISPVTSIPSNPGSGIGGTSDAYSATFSSATASITSLFPVFICVSSLIIVASSDEVSTNCVVAVDDDDDDESLFSSFCEFCTSKKRPLRSSYPISFLVLVDSTASNFSRLRSIDSCVACDDEWRSAEPTDEDGGGVRVIVVVVVVVVVNASV
mmetsp:Transcript_26608/g.63802  ORF Transcript_26608/g.63802 Transcript_26608/m.63802 type:complete len:276 (+) Transcript_26608:2398-3225(+)